MNTKKEYISKSSTYAMAYITLIFFLVVNAVLCRIGYGFFGINSGVMASFLNTIFIVITITILKVRNIHNKSDIFFLRLLAILIMIIYPLIISIAQIFSLFEFKNIAFEFSKFSIFKDTYIFLNIPLVLIILIVAARLDKLIDNQLNILYLKIKKKIYKKTIILLGLILFISGIMSFQSMNKRTDDEIVYLYGILNIESAVLAKIDYTNLRKKSFVGSMDFTNIETLSKFLRIEEDSVMLNANNLNEFEYIKIKNKRHFFKTFSEFYMKEFSMGNGRYSIIKIPFNFIDFEYNNKDYWELDYKNTEFIYGANSKEECEKILTDVRTRMI